MSTEDDARPMPAVDLGEAIMESRRTLVAWMLLVTSSVAVARADAAGPEHHLAAGSASKTGPDAPARPAVLPRPWISRSVMAPVRARLERGFDLAVGRLRSRPQCRALFEGLGSGGIHALTTTLYYPADSGGPERYCARANAYTTVGGAPTWVCLRIQRLQIREVALILIHEALHRAGLGEQPRDRDAPTSSQINRRVRSACGL